MKIALCGGAQRRAPSILSAIHGNRNLQLHAAIDDEYQGDPK